LGTASHRRAIIGTMRGSIERRGKAWRITIDTGPDPASGKRRQVRRTIHGTKADATDALNALIGEHRQGVTHGHDATVGQLLERWFATARLAPSTRADRRSALKHVTPTVRAMQVWRLRAHDLDAMYAELERQGLQAARIRTVHSVLRTALAQAVRWQWIARNPAVDASPPPVRRAVIAPPSPEDVRRLLAAADGRLAAYLRLSAHLGARRGEMCALRWDDIDLDGGQLTIRRAWSDGGRGVGMVLKTTKTDRERTVALDRHAVAMLRAWRAETAEVALAVGAHPGPWVFAADPLGVTAVRPDRMTHQFAELRRSLGLDGVRLHDVRHFVATSLLAAGVDPRTVAGRLGHARTSTTLDVYAAFVPARDRDAAEVLGRLLGQ
jgi:integrase